VADTTPSPFNGLQNAANLSHVKGPFAPFYLRQPGIYFPVSHASYFISLRDILIFIVVTDP
jgi:hypothetical protein